jgi:stearoyl-CoA desaturase (Delta-9 desaturase)
LSQTAEYHDDIIYPNTLAFIFVHLAPFAAIWTGVSTTAVVLAVVLYVVRMFGITAGYHRYFSHRSFKTSRGMQFLFAVLAMSSTQKSVLWWAALHATAPRLLLFARGLDLRQKVRDNARGRSP